MSDMIHREFPAELTPSGDGRTIDVRILPYGQVARVTDDGGRTFYEEQWEPGVFDHLKNAPNRAEVKVLANYEHQQGIAGVVARGTELRDSDTALEGTFRMLTHPDADKALELLNEGVLSGVSIEAYPVESVRDNGVVKRVKATLKNIAFCRTPAFPQAQVLAVREKMTAEDAQEIQEKWAAATRDGIVTQEEFQAAVQPDPEPAVARGIDLELRNLVLNEVAEALERVGVEPLITRAVTRKPWNGAASRFTDEEYVASCLIDRGGDAPPKERCSLPVLEPNGDLNANALGAAAGRLSQTRASTAQKSAAARKLLRYYRQAEMEAPPALRAIAAR